jgi:hypothetical protein
MYKSTFSAKVPVSRDSVESATVSLLGWGDGRTNAAGLTSSRQDPTHRLTRLSGYVCYEAGCRKEKEFSLMNGKFHGSSLSAA